MIKTNRKGIFNPIKKLNTLFFRLTNIQNFTQMLSWFCRFAGFAFVWGYTIVDKGRKFGCLLSGLLQTAFCWEQFCIDKAVSSYFNPIMFRNANDEDSENDDNRKSTSSSEGEYHVQSPQVRLHFLALNSWSGTNLNHQQQTRPTEDGEI
jgi:hypothetical protein